MLSLQGSHSSRGEIKVIIMILSDKCVNSVLWVPGEGPLALAANKCTSCGAVDQTWEVMDLRGLAVHQRRG